MVITNPLKKKKKVKKVKKYKFILWMFFTSIASVTLGIVISIIYTYFTELKYSHVNDLYNNNYKTVGYNRRMGVYQEPIWYASPKIALDLVKHDLLIKAMYSEVYFKNEYAIAMSDIVVPRGDPFYGKYYSFLILSIKRSTEDNWLERLLHFGHGDRESEWQNLLMFNLCIVNSTSSHAIKVEEQHSTCYMNKIETKIRNTVIQVSFDVYDAFSRDIIHIPIAFFYEEVSAALQSIVDQFKGDKRCFYKKRKKRKKKIN